MNGIVYFGPNSFDLKPWTNRENINGAIEKLKKIVSMINGSGFAKVKVPSNWSTFTDGGLDFWGQLEKITQDQSQQLLGFIASSLFDGAFNQCVDDEVTFSNARDSILHENPNNTSMEYFSALKVDGAWPSIPPELHVESKDDLFEFGVSFLASSPYSEESYSDRCVDIFTNLVFHDDFLVSLSSHGKISRVSKYGKAPTTGINGFSKSVTKCLVAANSVDLVENDTNRILREIQANCGFECSPEGGKNKHLSFEFSLLDQATPAMINCEFHIKISENNRIDGVFYQDRLYFGFTKVDGHPKIAVAHSGKHMNA